MKKQIGVLSLLGALASTPALLQAQAVPAFVAKAPAVAVCAPGETFAGLKVGDGAGREINIFAPPDKAGKNQTP